VYPIYGATLILKNKDNLDTTENRERIGHLYEGYRYKVLNGALFNVLAMARRILMVLAIT
jgi:hypothetical protein